MTGMEFWRRTALTIGAAVVVNAALFAVFTWAGADLLIPTGSTTQALTIVPVIATTVIGLVAAALLLLVLRKVGVSRPTTFSVVVIVLTVLSLGAPLTADVSAGNKVALASMHVVVGLAALIGLSSVYRRRETATTEEMAHV